MKWMNEWMIRETTIKNMKKSSSLTVSDTYVHFPSWSFSLSMNSMAGMMLKFSLLTVPCSCKIGMPKYTCFGIGFCEIVDAVSCAQHKLQHTIVSSPHLRAHWNDALPPPPQHKPTPYEYAKCSHNNESSFILFFKWNYTQIFARLQYKVQAWKSEGHIYKGMEGNCVFLFARRLFLYDKRDYFAGSKLIWCSGFKQFAFAVVYTSCIVRYPICNAYRRWVANERFNI